MTEGLKQLREALRRVKYEAASLADAQVIALEALTQRPAAQDEREAPYGYCPECGAPGVTRERRPDGDDKCSNGHRYPSRSAHASLPIQPAAQADCVGCEGKPSATNSPCAVCMGAQQATPEPSRRPLFAASVAARKWSELQEQGHRMQSLQFDGGPGGSGSIDPWGQVMWATPEPAGEPATVPRDAWDELERERDWWRTRARTAMQHHEGEVWYWMGDGEDHLESLVNNLPVVIRADQLRKMLTRPAPGVPEVDMDDLPGHLAEISIAVCDGDNLAAQSGLRDAIRLLAAQAKGAGHG